MTRGKNLRIQLEELFERKYVPSLQALWEEEVDQSIADSAYVVSDGLEGACSDTEAFDVNAPSDMYDKPVRAEDIDAELHPHLRDIAEAYERFFEDVMDLTYARRSATLLRDPAVQNLLEHVFIVDDFALDVANRFLRTINEKGVKYAFRHTPRSNDVYEIVPRTDDEIEDFNRRVK